MAVIARAIHPFMIFDWGQPTVKSHKGRYSAGKDPIIQFREFE
jgi:hypothetical protein